MNGRLRKIIENLDRSDLKATFIFISQTIFRLFGAETFQSKKIPRTGAAQNESKFSQTPLHGHPHNTDTS